MDQAERLRTIAKEQNPQPVNGARIITVTSGKGGVGKSNVAINLALQFRKIGKSVIILDADFGLANIEVMFGVIPKYNLSDLIFKGKELKDIITAGPDNVGFISGGSGIAKMVNLNNDQIKSMVYKLNELGKYADIIIVDTGAGISNSVLEFVSASPEVLLVTTEEPTSITDSYALLKALTMFPGYVKDETKIRVIANKVSSIDAGKNLFDKLSAVVGKFLKIDLELVGIIPYDDNISKAVMKQKPISLSAPDSTAAKSFENIAKVLEEGTTAVFNDKVGIARFFARILFRRKK